MRGIEDVLEAAREGGSVLDVNCATHRRGLGSVYPLPEILERARRVGVGITLGDDSHGMNDVGVGLDASMSAIAGVGYREVSYFVRAGEKRTAKSRTSGRRSPGPVTELDEDGEPPDCRESTRRARSRAGTSIRCASARSRSVR